jgi:hypothetical protein
MSRILLKEGGVFGNTDSGGVWLSVRFVRCWVKSHNATVKFETLSKFLMISRRKVRMTSSHHALTNSFFFFSNMMKKCCCFTSWKFQITQQPGGLIHRNIANFLANHLLLFVYTNQIKSNCNHTNHTKACQIFGQVFVHG